MIGDKLQQHATQIASSLALAELSYPFGDEIQVFKVMDKIFMLSFELAQNPMINLKVEPDQGEMLREIYPSIRTGYHMNKRHWISVYAGEEITAELVEDLVKTSYQLVTAKLNKQQKQVLAIHSAAQNSNS